MPKLQTTDLRHTHNTCEHIPNKETLEAFAETEEIIRKIRAGEYVKTFATVEELMADLMSDDEDEEDV